MDSITEREKEILGILKNNPMISQEDLAKDLDITRSAIAVHISNLIKKGFVVGRGYVLNDRTGVLVIGNSYIDIFADSGSRGESAQIEISPGGSGYNIAYQLSLQNIPVSLVSTVGRDEWGERIRKKLNEKGVDTRFVVMRKEYPTSRQLRLSEDGVIDRIVSDMRTSEELGIEFFSHLGVTVRNSRLVVMEEDLPLETYRFILEICKKAAVPICVCFSDSEARKIAVEDLNGLYLAIMGKTRVEKYSGVKLRDMEEGVKAGRMLQESGVTNSVIVFPDQGVTVVGESETVTVPNPPAHGRIEGLALHTLSAGLISGILHGYDFRQTLRLSMGKAAQIGGKSRNLSNQQE